MVNRVVHSDGWGDIIDRPDENCVEIRWFDASRDMSGDDFNEFLSTFAGHVEALNRSGALVDAVQFKMDMSRMSAAWRDEHIIPRYNRAGLKRFAFLVPDGMPAIGKEPAVEGPADFPTAYFERRADALAWLGG